MPGGRRPKDLEDMFDSDSEGLDWGEGDYADPAYDTDSTGDSDLDSTRTADLSDSELEVQSSSGSESDVDIEDIQSELRGLRVPLQNDTTRKARTRTPRLQPKPRPHAQNKRSRKVVDLRSSSPASVIEISSDSDSDSSSKDDSVADDHKKLQSRSRPQGHQSKLPSCVSARRDVKTTQKRHKRVILSSEEEESELDDVGPQNESSENDIWDVPESPVNTKKSKQNRPPRLSPAPKFTHVSPHPTTFFPNSLFKNLDRCSTKNEEPKRGISVERKGLASNGERSIFTIFRLLKHRNDQKIWIEGRRFVWISTFPRVDGKPLGDVNEVTAVIVENKSDDTSIHHLERFPIEEVLRVHVIKFVPLNVTGPAQQTPLCAPGQLFCKSVLFLEYRNREEWQSSQTKISGALRPLKPEEVGNSVPSTSG